MIRIVRLPWGAHQVLVGELPCPVVARKKPVEVDARQMPDDFEVDTLEGTMKGKAGDWLITGVGGEMYPCDAAIFEATYDIIDIGE